MESSIKVVRIIRFALVVSIVLYALMGEYVARPLAHPPDAMLFYALTGLAVVMVVLIAVVRRLAVVRAEEILSSRPADAAALGRWRAGYLVTYVLCEAVGLYGLVLRFLGFTLAQVAPFYVASIALMLFFSPRPPSRELS